MKPSTRIDEIRQQIDDLDRQILALLNARAGCARAIGELKRGHDLASFVPAREQEVLRAVAAANQGPLDEESLEAIYREILDTEQRLYGPVHARVARALYNVAWALYQQHAYEAAEPLLRQALEVGDQTEGPEHVNNLMRVELLMDVYV